MKKFLFFCVLVMVSTAVVGGPWPKNKGAGYFKLSEWWVIADQHYTDVGEIDPNITNGIFNTSIYGEYGFTDNLTIQLYFPFFSRAYFNNTVSGTTDKILFPGEAINSIGDAEVGITYGLWQASGTSVSVTGIIGLPLGNQDGGSQGNLQTGDGELNQIVKLEIGKSFGLGSGNGWLAAYMGYNNRTNGYSDEWLSGFQLGLNILEGKLTPSFRIESRQSRFNGDPNLALNFTSVFSNNTEYVSITPELGYNINEKWGLSVASGFVFSGKVIFARPSYSIGVYYKMD